MVAPASVVQHPTLPESKMLPVAPMGSLLDIGLAATGGDWAARDAVITAMEGATIDSPRGPLSFSRAHNPIQNIYLRETRNGRNAFVSMAQEAVKDPAHGCRLGH